MQRLLRKRNDSSDDAAGLFASDDGDGDGDGGGEDRALLPMPIAFSTSSASAAPSKVYSNGMPARHFDDDKDLKRRRQLYHVYVPIVLTLISLWTRLYKISWANYVVWDEAHFGKFASQYLKREFYFDVHPPMGKMLLGLSGFLSFYNGSFSFDSGKDYPPEVNYTGMRIFCALFGAFMVPVAYFTGIQLHMSKRACILLAIMVMCVLTVFAFFEITKSQRLSLGMVTSVKWVGLFAIALVGLNTIEDLWEMFGDLKMHPVSVASIDIAYLSTVTIKSSVRGGALLHSHKEKFPDGSQQQQVTGYHHQDANNKWVIHKAFNVTEDDAKPVMIKHGDVVRLVHAETGKNLHSHKIPGPVTKKENEVSAFGNITFGDENDLWVFEVVDDIAAWRRPTTIKSLTTRFLIRHQKSQCLLRYTGELLPQWGFKQNEVVCQRRNPDTKDVANMWNIESHWNSKLPTGSSAGYGRRFWKDFADLNVAMWNSNNAMTPDPDREPDTLTSHPWQWPFESIGLRICGWDDEHVKFFLLGHPILWIGSAFSLILSVIVWVVYVVRWQRRCDDWRNLAEWENFNFAIKVGVMGWFLHYIPFYIMGRVT
ncbi:Protein O-mannosyltransferase 2 [Physocladia obscura]|uniref:Dolichyl-phosphate-mannose--protein mannosyltransferase n=1 Tax=Physocladia obscura TaxID=109957 RepID=A0AAD5XHM4_9FUNG|nr:Protein O-mannosyltransferase 2 [Physocladia obscura]